MDPRETDERDGFRWPPRPVEAGAVERAAPGVRGRADSPEAPPAAGSTELGGWRGAVRSIERVWVGLETPPLKDRIAEAGWAPDEPGAYCGRCGSSVGPYEAGGDGCPACREKRLRWERMVRLGPFEGVLRDMVHEVKFTRWRRLGDQLGRMLGRSLARAMDAAGIDRRKAVLVPVPASFWRRMSRGIDHALVICRGVQAETGLRIEPALSRRHGPSQLAVPPGQRMENVAGSFRAQRGVDWGGLTVIVVDDVTTTRATLTAACRGVLACPGLVAGGAGRGPERVWTAVLGVTPTKAGRTRRKGV